MKLIDKDALVAEIERRINEINLDTIENWHYRLQWEHDIEVMKNILSLVNTLEVKEVDLEKEKVENIKKQCPFREVVCNKYQDHPLKCSGACAFVSDRITLEKKHLRNIQNVPVDEEKLKMDRRNTV